MSQKYPLNPKVKTKNFPPSYQKIRTKDYLSASLFDLMKYYKITPDISTCNKLLDIYIQDNNMDIAMTLFNDMKKKWSQGKYNDI